MTARERVCITEWLCPSVQAIHAYDLGCIQALHDQFTFEEPRPQLHLEQLMEAATRGHIAVARMSQGSTPGRRRIVGMGALYICHSMVGRVGRIGQFVVHTDVRRKGVGADLVEFIVDQATKMGCGQLGLTSDSRRAEAHDFWKKVGFSTKQSVVMRMQL